MRRGILVLLVSALVLGAVGCSRQERSQSADYVLYFLADDGKGYGPALDTQPYEGKGEPQVQNLLEALLAGPTQDGLASPFPRGVSVTGWKKDKESGILSVTMSEQYSGLADISLTLADYCIVLTLCQLEGVEGVEIYSTGYSGNYRSHQLLRPDEVEFTLLPQDGT